MGGDKAPDQIIKGVLKAEKFYPKLELILVGKNDIIVKKLKSIGINIENKNNLKIIDASEIIGMEETPAAAIKKKKNSSINRGTLMVKNNKADAFISAGNTGAVMGAGILNIGRISGIKRPSIAVVIPSRSGETLLIDAGANVDSKAVNLLQFAIMAQTYVENVLEINNPGIGLLNIGEESGKGNKLTREAFPLLQEDERINNFLGNVEGRDIFSENCDIVISDGFTGNVVLKTTEGAVSYLMSLLKEKLQKNIFTKLGALILKPYLQQLRDRIDYRKYGGAPLLGIKGVVIISHGSSDAEAIFNAVKVAKNTVDKKVINLIENKINRDGEINDS